MPATVRIYSQVGRPTCYLGDIFGRDHSPNSPLDFVHCGLACYWASFSSTLRRSLTRLSEQNIGDLLSDFREEDEKGDAPAISFLGFRQNDRSFSLGKQQVRAELTNFSNGAESALQFFSFEFGDTLHISLSRKARRSLSEIY